MNEVASYSRPGKVKHVAIGDGKIVGLYLNDRTHGSKDAVDATIEVIDRDTEDFENSKTFSVSTNIQPNDGKNVIAVNDSKIYVCQSGLGLYVYDMDGNEVGNGRCLRPGTRRRVYIRLSAMVASLTTITYTWLTVHTVS